MSIDYSRLGLRVGIEIHQQLNTKTKLFCACPTGISKKKEAEFTFIRRLRPTQSELGKVDPAALFEFQRGRTVVYEADSETSCLVEFDDEPPHNLNMEALEIALTVAFMLEAKPVNEIHVMRKVVIDGSTPFGFQRTCIVALGGKVAVGKREFPIQTICLEEDAARKTGEEGLFVHYHLDRLGIPLIEIATAPVIYSPEEARSVALALGRVLRATGRVKRGIGTIRQDLNISINDGAIIEVKGVQKLELVSKVVEYEVKRQLALIEIRDELTKRGIKREEIKESLIDVTSIFEHTRCRVLRKALDSDKVVLAVILPGFKGLLKKELEPGVRFGTELSDRAMFWGKVGGIFHTDELPGYGITQGEVEKLREALNAGEGDTVVFVADTPQNARDALKAVLARAREAIVGVPSETRGARPDGTTHYSRPRPGAARMYPETDVPPVPIGDELLGRLKKSLPETPEMKVKHLMEDYGINQKLAFQLVDSDYTRLFKQIVKGTKVSASVVAVTLTEIMKSLEREGFETQKISDEQIMKVFELVDSDSIAKEAIPEVLGWLMEHEGGSVEEAVKSLGLEMVPREEIERFIVKVVDENLPLIRERKEGAIGPLMGAVMREFRGRVRADYALQVLKEKIAKVIS